MTLTERHQWAYGFAALLTTVAYVVRLGVHPFSITNSLYLAFALAAVFGVVVKTVLYGHRSQEN